MGSSLSQLGSIDEGEVVMKVVREREATTRQDKVAPGKLARARVLTKRGAHLNILLCVPMAVLARDLHDNTRILQEFVILKPATRSVRTGRVIRDAGCIGARMEK